MFWQTTRFRLDLSQPRIMGIVNVTPDSFSDGGRFLDASAALAQCEELVRQGADILDIGGESSRPGAPTLPADEEWARIEPVLRPALTLGVPISVDTCKPSVMQRALDLGADIINDVHALEEAAAAAVVVDHGRCGVCLMHMVGQPADMQSQARYRDVVLDVARYLTDRLHVLQAQGLDPQRVILDPGIGFAKTPEHNLTLLRRQAELLALGRPLLLGWSRKSTLGAVTGRAVEDRVPASLAAALLAVERGARVVRVHDVAATADVLKVWRAAQP